MTDAGGGVSFVRARHHADASDPAQRLVRTLIAQGRLARLVRWSGGSRNLRRSDRPGR